MKRVIYKIFEFFEHHMYIAQILITLFLVTFLSYKEATEKTELWGMSVIVSILAVDIFLLCITYLEYIKKKLSEISSKGIYIELVRRNDFNIGQEIEKAKHDIFISGSALSSLNPYVDTLKDFPAEKSLRILCMDFVDKDSVNQFCKMAGKSLTYEILKKQDIAFECISTDEEIMNLPNIQIEKIDKVMPIAYFGVDLLDINSKSFIKVQQYLHEKSGAECINFIVRPGNELFTYYQEQINILWAAAVANKKKVD